MPFLKEKELHSEIKNTLKKNTPKYCAVAFVGKGSSSLIKGKTKIVCNLFNVGTNPFEIEKLFYMKNVSLRYLNNLHTKIYLTEKYVIHGSANMTNHALNFSGKGDNLIECADKVLKEESPEQYAEIRNFVKKLWKKGTPIHKKDILEAQEQYKTPSMPSKFNYENVCDSKIPYYVAYCEDPLSEENREVVKKEYGEEWWKDGYTVWADFEDLPRGYIIDLYKNKSGKIEFCGLSKYSGEKIYFFYKNGTDGEIEVAERVKCPKGFRTFVCEVIIPNVVKKIKTGKFKIKDGGGYCLFNKVLE